MLSDFWPYETLGRQEPPSLLVTQIILLTSLSSMKTFMLLDCGSHNFLIVHTATKACKFLQYLTGELQYCAMCYIKQLSSAWTRLLANIYIYFKYKCDYSIYVLSEWAMIGFVLFFPNFLLISAASTLYLYLRRDMKDQKNGNGLSWLGPVYPLLN